MANDVGGVIAEKPTEKPGAKENILHVAKAKFERVRESTQETDNRAKWIESMRFALADEEQWPQAIRDQRKDRPMLTINKLGQFIRQVANDARQNRPSIKVLPVDNNADPATAQVLADLVRNIEATSDADIAYDTAIEHAVGGGFGYIKVALEEADDDSFDLDIRIQRVADPLSIYGDPDSTAADSSDWNCAFETRWLSKEQFEDAYGDKAKADWDSGYDDTDWRNEEDGVLVVNYWRRTRVELPGFLMEDGTFLSAEDAAEQALELQAAGMDPAQPGKPMKRRTWKVEQFIMTGAEVLEGPIEFPGRYIPIIPVYGVETLISGRRYLRSLVYSAMDAQRMFNYWRTTATEMVALAPKVPWLVQEGSIDGYEDLYAAANITSIPYLPYKGQNPPQRMPIDAGPAAGAIQEAASASDDMKAAIGMYDASLGARSNETSGVAIQARQREGDVATFHFQDNQTRATRHVGRIVLGLIPHVYPEGRVLRVLGEDGTPDVRKAGDEMPVTDPETGQPMMQEEVDPATGVPRMVPMTRILDLAAGKYDVAVASGPSFTTRRQEAQAEMAGLMQAAPDVWQHVADIYAKAQDWPMAEEISKRLKERLGLGDPPPQVQEMQGQMEDMNGQLEQAGQQMQQLQAENEQLKQKSGLDVQKAAFQAQQAQTQAQGEADKLAFEREKLAFEKQKMAFDLQQERAKMMHDAQIAAQKIAADLEKARIEALANNPMMMPPMPMAPEREHEREPQSEVMLVLGGDD